MDPDQFDPGKEEEEPEEEEEDYDEDVNKYVDDELTT